MAGWIAVSWLGIMASFMFAVANYRPGHAPASRARLREVLTRLASVLAGRGSARTSC